jgi:hypothetical protein
VEDLYLSLTFRNRSGVTTQRGTEMSKGMELEKGTRPGPQFVLSKCLLSM